MSDPVSGPVDGSGGGGPVDPAAQGLAHRVQGARFTAVRMREGYEMSAVDDLLDDLADAALTGRALAPLVDAARFPTVRFREGYDMAGVDRFLAELVTDAAGSSRPAPATQPTPASSASPSMSPSSDPVVVEQRGLLARLLRR